MTNEYGEHPVATLATAGIFMAFFWFLFFVFGLVLFAVGIVDSIFYTTKVYLILSALVVAFGLLAAVLEYLIGVND